jgi:hypothetical protein
VTTKERRAKKLGGNDVDTGVRDGACTPKWLADLIGDVHVDPCSNERSHVRARLRACGLHAPAYDDGAAVDPIDGLALAPLVPAEWLVFINPPYSRGQVLRWVRAYRHVDFQFLLRFDTSTEWFEELCAVARYVWFPRRRRIEFEPPPGVEFSSNPYPHGLYCRSRPNAELEAVGYTFAIEEVLGC